MVGSVANLYESLENLNDSYINQNQTRDTILKPLYPATAGISDPLLAIINLQYFSDGPNTDCPSCHRRMDNNDVQYVAPPAPTQVSSIECGLVKGLVSYMVLDNLVVKPMSSVSCITLLNELNVKDVGALK
ncbi:hypothetical protein PHJA_002666200 [Phtheirospermum japonicum]|uniref:Uncharacterized protein n=1 Tax=Phtheirospermum japonicum TaxID=374723 RepID=A0A830CZ62_9LAMI|nr:hypothetical protein PHJA_002666200 [Phtheirospermum japonicum]